MPRVRRSPRASSSNSKRCTCTPARSSCSIAPRKPVPDAISKSSGSCATCTGVLTYQAAYPPAASTARNTSAKKVLRKSRTVESDSTMDCALLSRYGLLAVSGPDARAFLHAQLTNDIANLATDRSAFAGWCTAKGRLLATMLVIPSPDGFLLQLARDLAPAVLKRLSMFVLRSKVKIVDETDKRAQTGVWNVDWDIPDVAW